MDTLDILNKPMTEGELKNLNKILKCKTLNKKTRDKCFKILLYLTTNRGNIINYNLVLDRFALFCTNKKNNKRKCFNFVIDTIFSCIESIDETNFSHKTNLDILLLKISSVIKNFNNDVDDLELNEYVTKLMNSNLGYKNYELINLVSDNVPKNKKKREILFNILLTDEVTAYANWGRTYEEVLKVLNNNKILKLNNEYYEKVVKLVIQYVHSLTLDNIFDNKKMSDKKREYSIDYLLCLMEKYKEQYNQYRLLADEVAYDMMRQPIFRVLEYPSMLRISNNKFKQYLDEIVSSKNPNAYATFVALADNLSKEKFDIASTYIEDSNKKERFYEIDYEKKKGYVARAASGDVMKSISLETFKVILALMDSDIEKENVELNSIKDGICRLVCRKEAFTNREGRLLFVINKIINNPKKANEIISFAENKNSQYYSDSEYERIIDMIINTLDYTSSEYKKMNNVFDNVNRKRVYAIIDLFTNDNVEFIENKEILFKLALEQNTEFIENATRVFNKKGRQNQNIKKIFAGVSDDTYKRVTGKVRKLSQ